MQFRRPGAVKAAAFGFTFDLDKDSGDTGDAQQPPQPIPAADAQQLPIRKYRDELVYLVEKHSVVLLVGGAGCGKTTQIPQYLYHAGWADEGYQIVCTQPRRVAAAAAAQRVAQELGSELGQDVGFAAPFQNVVTPGITKLKYTTDEALLREFMDDPLLSAYSVVIVDEVHERSLASDLLLGLLRKVLKRRTDLRVVAASATMEVEKMLLFFSQLGSKQRPAVLSVEGKLYPVQIHYLKEPVSDYVTAAVEAVLQIHRAEVPGDALVFLSGQTEVERCVELLMDESRTLVMRAYVELAGMSAAQQAELFKAPPRDTRRAFIATNIAETGLTIEGVVYVIDTLFSKQGTYNPITNLDAIQVAPISKSAAAQRAGRAGRLRPGHCFRLCTEEAFQLKSIGIDNMMTFAWLDAPPSESAIRGLEELYALGALNEDAKLTQDVGLIMAELPLPPRLAAALLASKEHGCVEELLTIAAMMSIKSVWAGPHRSKASQAAKIKFSVAEGDMVAYLNVWRAWREHKQSSSWAYRNYINHRSMLRASDIRAQLASRVARLQFPLVSCGNSIEPVRKALMTGFVLSACTYVTTEYGQGGSRDYGTHIYRSILAAGTTSVKLTIDESSVLHRVKPECLVYASCQQGTDGVWRMRDLLAIDAEALATAAPHVFQYSRVHGDV